MPKKELPHSDKKSPQGPPCVHCGSTRTEKLSQFGPTLLLTQYYCLDCHSPFERVRLRASTARGPGSA